VLLANVPPTPCEKLWKRPSPTSPVTSTFSSSVRWPTIPGVVVVLDLHRTLALRRDTSGLAPLVITSDASRKMEPSGAVVRGEKAIYLLPDFRWPSGKCLITFERQTFFDDFPRLSCTFGHFPSLLVLSVTLKVIGVFPDGLRQISRPHQRVVKAEVAAEDV